MSSSSKEWLRDPWVCRRGMLASWKGTNSLWIYSTKPSIIPSSKSPSKSLPTCAFRANKWLRKLKFSIILSSITLSAIVWDSSWNVL